MPRRLFAYTIMLAFTLATSPAEARTDLTPAQTQRAARFVVDDFATFLTPRSTVAHRVGRAHTTSRHRGVAPSRVTLPDGRTLVMRVVVRKTRGDDFSVHLAGLRIREPTRALRCAGR